MDRHDIDALLVGALYGELTPADEARLTAHLESHPADRGALDDLKSARAKVRESRIFDMQAEPPQHISALLLQEAHRRAPKKVVADDGEKRDSWFWRFARSFALHPAMAAAAMLVVVLGVSAIAYKNKGSSSMREASPPAATQDKAEATPTEAPAIAVSGDTMAAGSAASMNDEGGFHAGLAEKDDLTADPSAAPERKKAESNETAATRWRSDTNGKAGKNQGIAVTTEQMQPKDLEEDRDERRNAAMDSAKLAKEKADQQQAVKKSAYDRAGELSFDGADDNFGAPSTGAAPGRGATAGASGGGGATSGLVGSAPQGNTVTKGNAGPAAAAPSPAPSTTPPSAVNRPYAQPPPPPPAVDKAPSTATTTAPAAKPTAPAKQEAKADAKPPSTSTATGAKTGGSSTTTDAKKVATQKPAEEKPAAEKTVQKAPPKAVSKQPAPAQQAPAAPPADPAIAWAKQQHARAVQLTKSGDCKGAAQVALGVSQKAPAYYASYMASDRDLKSCKSYIDDARDREAEKSAKSRAQKRVNADEPAAPAESVK